MPRQPSGQAFQPGLSEQSHGKFWRKRKRKAAEQNYPQAPAVTRKPSPPPCQVASPASVNETSRAQGSQRTLRKEPITGTTPRNNAQGGARAVRPAGRRGWPGGPGTGAGQLDSAVGRALTILSRALGMRAALSSSSLYSSSSHSLCSVFSGSFSSTGMATLDRSFPMLFLRMFHRLTLLLLGQGAGRHVLLLHLASPPLSGTDPEREISLVVSARLFTLLLFFKKSMSETLPKKYSILPLISVIQNMTESHSIEILHD